MCVIAFHRAVDRSASPRHFAGTGTPSWLVLWSLSEARGILGIMARPVRITRFDGAVLADTLFLIGQAWVKREAGDVDGGTKDLVAAMELVPPDTVEAILGFITDGTLPEPAPGPGGMDAWLETCRQAGAGELEVIRILFPSAAELAQE